MLSKVLPVLVGILFLSTPAYAQDSEDTASESEAPKFTILDYGQPAPFRGTLFDPTATAQILTLKRRLGVEYQLELDYRISELTATHQLEMTNMQSRYTALDEEYRLRIEAKDGEIEQLNTSLSKLSKDNRHWFAIGGFAIGVGVTVGIVSAIAGASK